jgi:pyruvate/2-oxoglutarate dehydrogenase complex dihydrolipoamide acyltransferase (E2) component
MLKIIASAAVFALVAGSAAAQSPAAKPAPAKPAPAAAKPAPAASPMDKYCELGELDKASGQMIVSQVGVPHVRTYCKAGQLLLIPANERVDTDYYIQAACDYRYQIHVGKKMASCVYAGFFRVQ